MKLSAVERALMNNPVRAFVQRYSEAARLERLGGRIDGGHALELGCGRGVGVELIFERFGADRVQAFDFDPQMVELARRRLERYLPERLHLGAGDATRIDAPDETFDAVFDFGVLHHVPDWQRAVAEVARVSKAAGRFYFEEVPREALDRWLVRTFTDHPRENRFSEREFVAELERHGIELVAPIERRRIDGLFTGVGRRRAPPANGRAS